MFTIIAHSMLFVPSFLELKIQLTTYGLQFPFLMIYFYLFICLVQNHSFEKHMNCL